MKLHFIPRGWWRSLKYLLLLFLASFITVLLAGNPISAIAQSPMPPEAIEQIPNPEATPQKRFQEIRGVWMTNNDNKILRDRPKLQNAVSQLAQLNFNTIYPVVWNSGYTLYESAIAQREGIQSSVSKGLQGQDIIADLIAQAHRQGLLVIPWFEFGFMAPPLSELTSNHPNWITQRRDGSQTWIGAAGEVVWLNPFHPEVQQFITDLVLEVVTKYDADGIQFDDHTSLPNEFGYDRYTLALYKQETKKDAPSNPKDPAWVRWRADKITAFMTQLNKAVKERKTNAIFSVAPNPYVTAYNTYLQDWLNWVRKDIVDELIVQVYRPNLQSFLDQLTRPEIQEVQQKIPTGVGVLTGLRNKPVSMRLIQSKVRAARDRGLGVTFFYYESLWDDAPEPRAERQSNFQNLFNFPASRFAIR
ncbi:MULTISPECIES: glycoside hydrolase family 10 protein [unclassified Coleofasciculus]|uniref:family 10 glycosylhydrolase n=1 Tax=Cyanophyceae TaxID=3028117 RepID=UPI001684E7AF|nr:MULTISPECIES: glycoside hydrolase family 10 protein [unclassified Coleofasciculus]MBD2083447.1 glycoside hydrolase family 10 protein [Coleofasciculus sp. FACHB-542]MBD2539622.1 glycoside hydrolase family 10 protein [Coleofasciculus sp. FACHB-SPT36]